MKLAEAKLLMGDFSPADAPELCGFELSAAESNILSLSLAKVSAGFAKVQADCSCIVSVVAWTKTSSIEVTYTSGEGVRSARHLRTPWMTEHAIPGFSINWYLNRPDTLEFSELMAGLGLYYDEEFDRFCMTSLFPARVPETVTTNCVDDS